MGTADVGRQGRKCGWGSHGNPDGRLRNGRLIHLSKKEKMGTVALSLESKRPSPRLQGTGSSLDPPENEVGEILQASEADNHMGSQKTCGL